MYNIKLERKERRWYNIYKARKEEERRWYNIKLGRKRREDGII